MVVGSSLKSLREFKNLSQGHIERRTNRRAISPLNMYILSIEPSFFLRLQRKRVYGSAGSGTLRERRAERPYVMRHG
jgi:hypothetical protein